MIISKDKIKGNIGLPFYSVLEIAPGDYLHLATVLILPRASAFHQAASQECI